MIGVDTQLLALLTAGALIIIGLFAAILIDNLIKKILNGTAGSDYIGEYDKKHYFWSSEKGEQMQVAISLTCPKNQVSVVNTDSDEIDFENIQAQPTTFTPAEITQEEKDKVKELMDKLGL